MCVCFFFVIIYAVDTAAAAARYYKDYSVSNDLSQEQFTLLELEVGGLSMQWTLHRNSRKVGKVCCLCSARIEHGSINPCFFFVVFTLRSKQLSDCWFRT